MAWTSTVKAEGTVETGSMLAEPYKFVDVQLLTLKRAESFYSVRQELTQVVKQKWKEATTSSGNPELIKGQELRDALRVAQSQCKATNELLAIQRNILGSTAKDSMKGLEAAGKDYRL